jgi:hypothetical protein
MVYICVQRWRGDIANSSRGHFYSIFKQEFCMEPYLTRLTEIHRKFRTKLNVNNIKFPIETVAQIICEIIYLIIFQMIQAYSRNVAFYI